MTRRSFEERFWEKVDMRGPDDCWPWKRSCNPRGYGHVWRDGECVDAHRVALELRSGAPLQPGEEALHSCDNPPCCNPAHLFRGTQRDNIVDMHSKHRHPGGRGPLGEASGASRLTARQVVQIRSERGVTQHVLARRYGVSQKTISRVLRGETWREPDACPV